MSEAVYNFQRIFNLKMGYGTREHDGVPYRAMGPMAALSLAFTDEGFLSTAKLIIAAHVPVMIIEGFVTMFTVGYLAKMHPTLLGPCTALQESETKGASSC